MLMGKKPSYLDGAYYRITIRMTPHVITMVHTLQYDTYSNGSVYRFESVVSKHVYIVSADLIEKIELVTPQ